MMDVSVKSRVISDVSIPEKVADALAVVGHVTALAQVLRRMGLTRDEAVSRIGNALAAAWEE